VWGKMNINDVVRPVEKGLGHIGDYASNVLSGAMKVGGYAAIVAGFVGLAASYSPASAQTLCAERANMLERLKVAYAENPTSIGLTTDGAVLEVLSSPTGSWSVLVTYPGMQTCMTASGNGWEKLLYIEKQKSPLKKGDIPTLNEELPMLKEGLGIKGCTKRSEVVSHLDTEYSEAPAAIGLANNGSVMEVYSTINGSTWTLTFTMINGMTCAASAGENLEWILNEQPEGQNT